MTQRALLLVDVQNDFCPGGGLPVPEGDQIIPLANQLQTSFSLVLATQDWHPADHLSFAVNHPGTKPGDVIQLHGLKQVLWPVHCVQESWGAEFVPQLDTARVTRVFRKGVDREVDSYSGFFDNGRRRDTGLNAFLREHAVQDVFVAGLATDYCVKFTALDALRLGFKTSVVADACRAVNLEAGDDERALHEMAAAGAVLVTTRSIAKHPS